MKAILCSLLVFTMTITSSFGATRSVKADVEALGKLAMGWEEYSVKGKNAEEILKNHLDSVYGDDIEMVNKEYEEMAFGDEGDQGPTSARSAINMSAFAVSVLEENIEGLDADVKEEAQEMKELKAKI